MFDNLNSIADLRKLIENGFREGETLEYKRATEKLTQSDHKEVAKDVSAFANSSGGLIIYGIATATDDKAKPVGLESVAVENPEIISQVISSHVRHPVSGVRTKVIEDGQIRCFLVDIPASSLAPHQVITDHKYYRRNGSRSEPMTHDLVELYFNRRLGPMIECRFDLQEVKESPSAPPFVGTLQLTISLRNIGARSARHLYLMVDLPIGELMVLGEFPEGGPYFCRPKGTITSIGFMDHEGILYPELETDYRFTFGVHEKFVRSELPCIYVSVHADDMRAVRQRLRVMIDDRGSVVLGIGSHE